MRVDCGTETRVVEFFVTGVTRDVAIVLKFYES